MQAEHDLAGVDPRATLPENTILLGDCLDLLRTLPDNSIDALVTDPPYGLGTPPNMTEVLQAWLAGEVYQPRSKKGFMGKDWDAFVPGPDYWRECLRVLKPGGHALIFSGTHTWDVMGLALRLAGFEIRDTLLAWLYGSGFPKSADIAKHMDKLAGAEREVVRTRITPHTTAAKGFSNELDERPWMTAARAQGYHEHAGPTPVTDAAKQWDGWGSALKPAWEPVILCRKPLSESSIAANVLRWGVGAINVDACRVPGTPPSVPQPQGKTGAIYGFANGAGRSGAMSQPHTAGRWPPNLLFCHAPDCTETTCVEGCPVAELDRQSGVRQAGARLAKRTTSHFANGHGTNDGERLAYPAGAASQFFPTFRYTPKASRAERTHGGRVDNWHCTVKPLALCRWLLELSTPPGGLVLDPFAGSGSILVAAQQGGWRYLGMEQDPAYVAIAQARLAASEAEEQAS